MGFASLKVDHAHKHKFVKRADRNPSCMTGGFYQAPQLNQVVDALQPLTIKWDTSCLDTKEADIYLFAPSAQHSRVAVFQRVNFPAGSVTVDLMPRWWNATASENLQIGIIPTGNPLFLSDLPAGPVFTAKYTAPSSGPVPEAADTSITTSAVIDMSRLESSHTNKGLSSGKIAAAIIIPLLFVILAVAVYIKWQRKKSQEKSKRFSMAIDKRMSTISTDWKSVTAAGANAAIRNSIAFPGNRASSFSFGAIRPTSNYVLDDNNNNQAGIGARHMAQVKTGVGVGLRNPATLAGNGSTVSFAETRQSRVSFAELPRPSMESRRTRAFRDDYVPPVPSLPSNVNASSTSLPLESDISDGTLSPTQTQGPLTLTSEDIRARIAAASTGRSRSASNATSPGNIHAPRKEEIDEVMPALSMMRTGKTNPGEDDDYLIARPPVAVTKPAPETVAPSRAMTMSPVMGTMAMAPLPANVMSPDEMLRAYAERKKAAMSMASTADSSTSGTVSPTHTSSGGMRPLFGPTGVVSPTNTGDGNGHNKNMSVGVGHYGGARYTIGDEEDPYGGI